MSLGRLGILYYRPFAHFCPLRIQLPINMKKLSLIALLLFCTIGSLFSQDKFRTSGYNIENGLAIKGYDPVAYISQNRAVKGLQNLAYTFAGITYYFATEANLQTFKKNPSIYEPQYGGWCAYAMGVSGEKVEIDPKTFKVVDGKLYLFYNFYFNNTLTTWNKDEKNLAGKADQNWSSLVNKYK